MTDRTRIRCEANEMCSNFSHSNTRHLFILLFACTFSSAYDFIIIIIYLCIYVFKIEKKRLRSLKRNQKKERRETIVATRAMHTIMMNIIDNLFYFFFGRRKEK